MTGFLVAASGVHAAVKIYFCNGGCLCIDYTKDAGDYLEIRCNGSSEGGGGGGGWTTIPPGPGNPPPQDPGSFGGDGDPGEPVSPHPCNPVTGVMSIKLGQAKTWAETKLSWLGPPGPETRRPTTCTTLFMNSPLGRSGKSLLDEQAAFHAIFRDGQSCTLPNGDPSPCDSGNFGAVATCCGHSPYIYLCDAFADLSQTEAGLLLIHELLHLAGQREDLTPSTGPGDPPTTHQLNDVVREACLNPQVVPSP